MLFPWAVDSSLARCCALCVPPSGREDFSLRWDCPALNIWQTNRLNFKLNVFRDVIRNWKTAPQLCQGNVVMFCA